MAAGLASLMAGNEQEATALEAGWQDGEEPAAAHEDAMQEDGEPEEGTPEPPAAVPVGGGAAGAQHRPGGSPADGTQRKSKFGNVYVDSKARYKAWYGQVGGGRSRLWTPKYNTEEEAARAVDK